MLVLSNTSCTAYLKQSNQQTKMVGKNYYAQK